MYELVKTGVAGLDSILGGGFVENATVLVSGNPGTGKSIFGLQYLYRGAIDHDQDGLYLSFEENAADIRQAARSVGFDEWPDLVEADRITVYDKSVLLRQEDFQTAVDELLGDLSEGDYDRLVLDSLSMFQLFFDDETERRTYLLKFSDILKSHGVTAVLINEQGSMFPDADMGMEHFLTDGNVYFIQTPTGSGVDRYVWVAKMRKQSIDTDVFPMEIGEGGLTVHEGASGFSLMREGRGGPF
jgi:KaiC/GvpD/RAD55 family RecA-like ATPase